MIGALYTSAHAPNINEFEPTPPFAVENTLSKLRLKNHRARTLTQTRKGMYTPMTQTINQSQLRAQSAIALTTSLHRDQCPSTAARNI